MLNVPSALTNPTCSPLFSSTRVSAGSSDQPNRIRPRAAAHSESRRQSTQHARSCALKGDVTGEQRVEHDAPFHAPAHVLPASGFSDSNGMTIRTRVQRGGARGSEREDREEYREGSIGEERGRTWLGRTPLGRRRRARRGKRQRAACSC